MSVTMARQGDRVQLEQSNRRPALTMAKMAKEGYSLATIDEMQQLTKNPPTEVREEKKWGVVFPGHNKVYAAIERHPAMVRANQTDGCLRCQNGTAMDLHTHCRCKGTGAPPPRPLPPRPGTPPALPDDSERTQSFETDSVPPGYLDIHTPLPTARCFNFDLYAKDRMRDRDSIPNLMSDEGPSTG